MHAPFRQAALRHSPIKRPSVLPAVHSRLLRACQRGWVPKPHPQFAIIAESTVMIHTLPLRRNWKRLRSSKRRTDLLKRLRIGEQLEVRAAPGSMLVDVLAGGGHPVAMAQRAYEAAQESRDLTADSERASAKRATHVGQPQRTRDADEPRESVADIARAERPTRPAESTYHAAIGHDPRVGRARRRLTRNRTSGLAVHLPTPGRRMQAFWWAPAWMTVWTRLGSRTPAALSVMTAAHGARPVHPTQTLLQGSCRIFPRDRGWDWTIERAMSPCSRTIHAQILSMVEAHPSPVFRR